MKFSLLVAALRLVRDDLSAAPAPREAPCGSELARLLAEADEPGQVGGDALVQGQDPQLAHARRTSVLFHGLGPRCAAEYRAWQAKQLPRSCAAPYQDFLTTYRNATPALALPAWEPPATRPNATAIAYLVSASSPAMLPVLKRTFEKLYRPEDTFLYLVDTRTSPGYDAALRAALPYANVRVEATEHHAMLYFWPRVENVLAGLARLLEDRSWTHLYHLSESDYPLHGRPPPLRGTRHRPRQLEERDHIFTDSILRAGDNWYWWSERTAVFDCEGFAVPDLLLQFPAAEDLEAQGWRLARGGEWFGFPRTVAEYLVSPRAKPGVDRYVEMMRHRWGADEVFWATLVRSVPGLEADVPVAPGWFVLWDMQNGHSPDCFQGEALAAHRQEILASQRLFVRKVALPGSEPLLDELDS